MIADDCTLQDGLQGIECLRTLSKLQKFHRETSLECNLDDLSCIVLDILDRLCANIQGKDGFILLNRVSGVMGTFRSKFTDWSAAFKAADADGSGHLSLEDLIAALRSAGATVITDDEVRMVFHAADANGDGVISAEEFSNFMVAAVFAEEPLKALQVDALPSKQPSFEDYLHWTTRGRDGSWAALR
mmetsp:Transcript_44284/g.140846  ORF Transcript_44284/g.140846 Transcript_44284/m.140846 type:complete len:187 (-) Transcript_44284:173-733(-)